MLQLTKPPGVRVLELGGGNNRHPMSDVNVDVRQGPQTDFTADFEAPLPIADADFEVVYCAYCLEHVTWRKVPAFLSEVYRVLKTPGKAVFLVPNTEAQLKWVQSHPEGWDGKSFFESASGVLFGDCDYPENSHKAFLSPDVVHKLFTDAGFSAVQTRPHGERNTDLLVEALKGPRIDSAPPVSQSPSVSVPEAVVSVPGAVNPIEDIPPEELYDKDYWNGGAKYGGYAREGYWDYPVHRVTANHILSRKPESVLELGAARGYVLKRIQDAGIPGVGLEVSQHCVMTAVAGSVWQANLLAPNWGLGSPIVDKSTDLCYSIAVLEHIPRKHIPHVIAEMARTCKRGLHGIDFGGHDDGFDKTHCSLLPKSTWQELFALHAPGWPVEILDKEELEKGEISPHVYAGDGKVKLNVGCSTVMYHDGWVNLDINDQSQWAQQHRYNFLRHDLNNGLPYDTGTVHLIHLSHVLEHFDYQKGLKLLKECRRVLRPEDGILRVAVPDAGKLMREYSENDLSEYDHINYGCAAAPSQAMKFWELLHAGHSACYDETTLVAALRSAGFVVPRTGFRNTVGQMAKETLDMFQCLSLYADAEPAT